jgi:hypothetical protein
MWQLHGKKLPIKEKLWRTLKHLSTLAVAVREERERDREREKEIAWNIDSIAN